MLIGISGGSGGLKSILSSLVLIIIFILILVLAYFATKFIAKYQGNMINSKSNIRILESFRVSGNKFIAIVKIGEGYYAMSVGKDEMHLIDKLNPDELKLGENGSIKAAGDKPDFNELLVRLKNRKSKDENDIK
jgi:flagellar protein FliO/FliZ